MKAVAFAAVTSLVLLFVWERVDIVRIGYHIERLKTQKVLLERERDELQVKLSGLTAPERIARLASDKLGMMQPEKGQVVVINIEPEAPPHRAPVSRWFLLLAHGHHGRLGRNVAFQSAPDRRRQHPAQHRSAGGWFPVHAHAGQRPRAASADAE